MHATCTDILAATASTASKAPRAARCPLRRVAEVAGFTLVELLVVMAILAALVAVLIPVMSRVRATADKAREVSAARGLLSAWQQYAHDSNGNLLPGYRAGLPAFDERREPIAAQTIGVTANRWVWRLAPYIGHDFNALYVGENERLLRELETTDYSNYLYQTSVFPSFGLNSAWVGGDENFGGFSNAFLNLYGKFYATRMSEIARPATLAVFASARGQDTAPGGSTTGVAEGFFRIRSPYFDARVWGAAYDPEDPAAWGNLSARNGGEIVTGFADGHVESLLPEAIDDMRLWAPNANAKDWRLTPGGG